MPTYQYRCTACSEDLEAVQSFSDPALTDCPSCGGNLRKVFGSVGVVFKGSGFYKTDSRPNGKSGSAAKETTSSSSDSSSADSSSSSSSSGDNAPASSGSTTSTSSTSSTSSSASAA